MIRVWHISDPHLSMNDDMVPIKPMHLRKWAIGSWTFTGYIEAIQEFAKANISDEDVTFITGDIVHDMWGRPVYNSLNWLRANIPGHIVICRGNHDRDWQVGKMKLNLNLPRFHIVGEGEIMQLGPFTIGCFSDHSIKTDNMSDLNAEYASFAAKIVEHAKDADHGRIPVMISHYPVSPMTAEVIGQHGVKAYMSGHVHCTAGNEDGNSNGVLWKWYDLSAGLTDDKFFKECFFSTGTVDVLRAKHGQPFKEIECLRQHMVSNADIDKHKPAARQAFGCNVKFIDRFHKVDPFNPKNFVTGLICREKGLMQGSLLITHVNGKTVNPQLVFGTPKLAYPYENDSSRKYKKFKPYRFAYFAEKWNGMNVLFYKYKSADGKWFVTAKSKGTAFLQDSEVGNFLTLTKQAVSPQLQKQLMESFAYNKDIAAMSFELCGRKEPHLVKYDFDIELKPLFIIKTDGNITPVLPAGETFHTNFDGTLDIEALCKHHQAVDFERNKGFRKYHGLEHKYEYEHFEVEGKVLYLLDDDLNVLDRTLYKVKPEDIEEVHWQTFDKTFQGRVKEAIFKLKSEGQPISEKGLQDELDMGAKEWSKFGKTIWKYAQTGEANPSQVVVLVGLPGSGKSTVAKEMEKYGYVRVNQDELGSRNACKKVMAEALKARKNVVVDRCNFDELQRKSWTDLANSFAVTNIIAVVLDVDHDTCIARASARTDHPTIQDATTAQNVVHQLGAKFTRPTVEEGFRSVQTYEKNTETSEIVSKIRSTNVAEGSNN